MSKTLKNKWRVIGIALILLVLLGIVLIFPRASIATPSIGIYYYPWYVGEWGSNHKNCPDTPYLGDYNSANLSVIAQHLNWLRHLKVDFIILSWWGKNSPSDNNTKLILNQIKKNYADLQFFIMVEPFGDGWSEAYNSSSGEYDFTLIYNYIYNNYITRFNSNCFYLDGKPVIGFYDGPDRNITRYGVPSDERFSLRLIGCQPDDDWKYEVPNSGLSIQPVCRDGEISVCPRYDAQGWIEDVNYTEGSYDAQWSKAMSEVRQGNVKIITIISWNEYSERTQIEPTFDTTSAFTEDSFYLFDKTQAYIESVKSGPAKNEANICLHLSDYDGSTFIHLNELGVEWVRTDWSITPDNSMRDYSQNLQDNNISLLAIIDVNTFNNQSFTLEDWNNNVTEIVNSYGFKNTDAVEIWNEPNSVAFVQPEIYYEMLKSAYTIIKNYTSIPIVFAGVSPNVPDWQAYLNAVFDHDDIQSYFDIMGIHLYDDMATNLDTLQFVKNLTTKPVWLTETGQPSETENYNETSQAEYLSSVYSTFKPLVNKIFIYELKDGYGSSPDKENYFGLLKLEGTTKEAYWVICDINREIGLRE